MNERSTCVFDFTACTAAQNGRAFNARIVRACGFNTPLVEMRKVRSSISKTLRLNGSPSVGYTQMAPRYSKMCAGDYGLGVWAQVPAELCSLAEWPHTARRFGGSRCTIACYYNIPMLLLLLLLPLHKAHVHKNCTRTTHQHTRSTFTELPPMLKMHYHPSSVCVHLAASSFGRIC